MIGNIMRLTLAFALVVVAGVTGHTLVVDPNGVMPGQVTGERMQSIARRHFQILESHHGVDLVELAAHGRRTRSRYPGSCRRPASGSRLAR